MAKAPKRSTPSDSALVENIIDALAPRHGGEAAARKMLTSGMSADDLFRALDATGWVGERIGHSLIDAANSDNFVKTPKLDGPVRFVRLPNGALVSAARPPPQQVPSGPRSEASPAQSHDRGAQQGRNIGTMMLVRSSPPRQPPVTQLQYFTTKPAEPVRFYTDSSVRDDVLLRLLEPSTDPQSAYESVVGGPDAVVSAPPAPTELTTPQAPQLPELLATRPNEVPELRWKTARTIYKLGLGRDTSTKREIEVEKVSKELGYPEGKPSLRTYYEALRWLRDKKLI